MISERAYDCDPLDQRLRQKYGIRLIVPHKYNRRRKSTQDGPELPRCCPAGKSSTSLPDSTTSADTSAAGNITKSTSSAWSCPAAA
jgi:hypothetical protein